MEFHRAARSSRRWSPSQSVWVPGPASWPSSLRRRPPRLEITGLPVSLAVVAPFQDVPQLEVERTESFPKVRLQSQKIAWGWGGGIPDLRDQPRLAPARPPLISLEFAMTFSSSPPRMKIREGETPGEPMEMACPQAV
jgi:hypothetical protein